MSGQTSSEAFSIRLVPSFTVKVAAEKNFPLLLKSFVSKALEYKGSLN